MRLCVYLSAPFLVVIGSHEFASTLLPGKVLLSSWEWFASLIFIAFLGASLCVLAQPKQFREGRIVVGIIVSIFFIGCALVVHVHTMCQPISPYLGGEAADYSVPA